jgi:putative ABC transport system substrate-binding protein
MVLLVALNAWSEELLAVMSLRSSGYSEVIDSARKTCAVTTREIYLNETPDADLARIVRESRSRAVLALGDKAFQMATLALPRTPVVGVLTLEQQSTGRNVKSISYLARPEQYLSLMKQINRRKVGVVYGVQMAAYIKRAEKVAQSYGIVLEKREIQGPQGVAGALTTLVGQVDALWVLPDSAVVTQETIEHLFNFANATNTPAIVFSKNYLKTGAAVALEPERSSMGAQAGRHVCEVLEIAPKGGNVTPVYSIQSNHTVLKKLGIAPL